MQSLLITTTITFPHEKACCQHLSQILVTSCQLTLDRCHWQFLNFRTKFLIDDVRALQTSLSQSGGQQLTIFVITDFDRTSRVVQNALLKLLEEPPSNTLLILLCANLRGILPTIRSRCQIIIPATTSPAISYLPLPQLNLPDFISKSPSYSHLAHALIDTVTTAHRTIKADQPEITLTTVTDEFLTQTLHQLHTDFHHSSLSRSTWNYQYFTHYLAAIDRLRANVTPKNVLYQLALDLKPISPPVTGF
jgi:hypothetical protein